MHRVARSAAPHQEPHHHGHGGGFGHGGVHGGQGFGGNQGRHYNFFFHLSEILNIVNQRLKVIKFVLNFIDISNFCQYFVDHKNR